MKTLKLILDMVIEPYKKLPWNSIGSIYYTTFGLWCFNLAVLLPIVCMTPLFVKPEFIFEAIGRFISAWIINPYQLYYVFFCFIWSIILNTSEL